MKKLLSCVSLALCVTVGALCLSACKSWRDYSLDFQTGAFQIKAFEENLFFTEESRIEISFDNPENNTEALIAQVNSGEQVYFLFYNLSADIEEINQTYIAQRSLSFAVKMKNEAGYSHYFTIYAYDWSQRIYFLSYDFYFEKI